MNELESMATAVGEALKANGETVMVGESACGGLISAALLAVPGASAYYRGGLVLYTYESRRKFLSQDGKDPFEGGAPQRGAGAPVFRGCDRVGAHEGRGDSGVLGPLRGRTYAQARRHCSALRGPPGSEEYAAALARAVRATLNPTWAISEVGTAGPTGGRRGNSPGHACIAVDGPRARAVTIETRQSDRVTNMRVFARAALDLLAALLRETPRT